MIDLIEVFPDPLLPINKTCIRKVNKIITKQNTDNNDKYHIFPLTSSLPYAPLSSSLPNAISLPFPLFSFFTFMCVCKDVYPRLSLKFTHNIAPSFSLPKIFFHICNEEEKRFHGSNQQNNSSFLSARLFLHARSP